MKWKLGFLIVFCLSVILVGCQEDQAIRINTASVEIGSPMDRDEHPLHFRVDVDQRVSGQSYNVRFIIKDKNLRELIGQDKVEVEDTYISRKDTGLVTGTSVELTKSFNVDEIRKSVEKGSAVIVELYNGNKIIDQEKVKIFNEFIMQLVKINPKKEIQKIEITDGYESIFNRAVSDAMKVDAMYTKVPHPKVQFSIGDESYYLWVRDNEGFIMNTRNTFTLYTLSDRSLKEVKEIIK